MSSFFEPHLKQALENAPTETPDNIEAHNKLNPSLSGFELDPDDAVITFEESRHGPTDIVVKEVDIFKQLLSHPLLWRNAEVETLTINSVVRHEEAHALVAKQLGADDISYGLSVLYVNREKLEFLPFFRIGKIITSKLGLAAIFAQPINPSPADIAAIKQMGYGGIADVTARILKYNLSILNEQTSDANDSLPVPMSYLLRSFPPEQS